MSIKILTQNSIDNTNIDGARQNHFSAGMRSGIVKGAFNEGKFFASASNIIALDSCELRISGHQVVIDSTETITLNDRPSTPTKYSMIAEIQVSDSSVPSFRLFIQPANVSLKKDNLFKTNNGNGTYQLRIGNFTLGTTGLISDVVRTADIITGGGEGGVADIKFNATATQLSSSSQPEANADYNEETKEWDLHFGIPAGSGSKVTIGGVEQPTWSADFAESERQKSKNLLLVRDSSYTNYGYTVTCTNGEFTLNGSSSDEATFSLTGTDGVNSVSKYAESLTITTGNSVKFKAGTYTFSSNSETTALGILYGDMGSSVSTGATLSNITPSKTLVFNNDTYVVVYRYVGSNTYTNYSIGHFQAEEGSVATDYQPYQGGRFVQEKDIVDVEHIETIYDKDGVLATNIVNTSDVPQGQAYTTGLPSGITCYIETSKYKRLIFSVKLLSYQYRIEVDKNIDTPNAYVKDFNNNDITIWGGYPNNFSTAFGTEGTVIVKIEGVY